MNIPVRKYRQAYIEISNRCNLKCSFCPSPGLVRQRDFMKVKTFAEIIVQVEPLVEQVYLHVLGEPLLHPQLDQILACCENVKIPVELTTNGVLLKQHAQLLLKSKGIRQINFSLQALLEGTSLQSPQETLSQIMDFCVQVHRDRPEMYVNLRLWNIQVGDPQSEKWNQIFIQVLTQKLQIPEFNFQTKTRRSIQLRGRIYANVDTRFEWPTRGSVSSKRGTCHALDSHFAILVDGRVIPCCLDSEGEIELGRIPDMPLIECLNGSRAQAMVRGFQQFELVESLCQSCTFCKRFKSTKNLRLNN